MNENVLIAAAWRNDVGTVTQSVVEEVERNAKAGFRLNSRDAAILELVNKLDMGDTLLEELLLDEPVAA